MFKHSIFVLVHAGTVKADCIAEIEKAISDSREKWKQGLISERQARNDVKKLQDSKKECKDPNMLATESDVNISQSYSSVASTSGWAYGYGVGYSSRNNADVVSLRECHSREKGQCYIALRFKGAGCVALSNGPDGAGGWGAANGHQDNRSVAQNRALKECNSRGDSCSLTSTGCTNN